MTIAINYKNSPNKKGSSNLVLFVDEKFNILSLKKHIANSEYKYILDIIKSKNLKKKILTFDFSSKKKIILISLNKQLKSSEAENLGAEFFEFSKNISNSLNLIPSPVARSAIPWREAKDKSFVNTGISLSLKS